MAFFLTAFLRGWIVTGPLHRRALDRNDALSEIARRQSVSLDRLTRYLGKV